MSVCVCECVCKSVCVRVSVLVRVCVCVCERESVSDCEGLSSSEIKKACVHACLYFVNKKPTNLTFCHTTKLSNSSG